MTPSNEETVAVAASAAATAAQAAAQAAQAATEASKIGARAIELAAKAEAKIEQHVKVDEILHNTLLKNQDDAKSDRLRMHAENADSIRRIYALLWKVALAVIFGLAAALYAYLKK